MSGCGAASSHAAPGSAASDGGAPASRRFVVLTVVGVVLAVATVAGAAWLLLSGDGETDAVPVELAAFCRESSQLRAAADAGDITAMEGIVGGWERPADEVAADPAVADLAGKVVTVLAARRYIEVVSGDPSFMVIPALRLELECTRLDLVDEVAPSPEGDDTPFEAPESTAAPTTAPVTTTTAAPAPPEPAPTSEPCEGASGCAFENGIDIAGLRSELAAELTSTGLPTTPDDVGCEQGAVPPNRVPVGDSFVCVVTPDVNGALSAFEVTVTGIRQYEWKWADA